jgi:Domain of unknown function (DUF4124)
MSRAILLLSAVAAFAAGDACADLYKCVGKDGKVSYQGEPCPSSTSERRLRAPAAGASAEGPSGPMKEGWTEELAGSMRAGCLRDGIASARRGWGRSGDARQFPEAEFREAFEKHCACIVRRATTSMSRAEFANNVAGHLLQYAADAANGRECKLEIRGYGR